MSLISQCPACSTMFRVVPDQLRISEGWVRCGHCDEVFDANAHLRTLDEPPNLPSAGPAQAPEPAQTLFPQAPAHSTGHAGEPYDWGLADSHSRASTPPTITLDVGDPLAIAATVSVPQEVHFWEDALQESTPEPEPEPGPELFASADAVPADDGVPPHEQDITSLPHSEVPEDAFETLEDVAHLEHLEHLEDVPVVEDVPLSFLTAETAPSWSSRGPGKKILLTLCILLLVVLGLQWLLSERDRIYATAPALRPLLSASCRALGCTIVPPRQIDAIAIDSSSFTSVKPGVYLLKVTLKNAAAIELAAPALELTLTDTQDQPLLRRIVLATELQGLGAIAPGAELAASLPIRVNAGTVTEQISGYKLFAFYP